MVPGQVAKGDRPLHYTTPRHTTLHSHWHTHTHTDTWVLLPQPPACELMQKRQAEGSDAAVRHHQPNGRPVLKMHRAAAASFEAGETHLHDSGISGETPDSKEKHWKQCAA